MKIKAEQKNIRTSARKLRLVADTLKGLSPQLALQQLALLDKRAALPLSKVIKQALANATNNHQLNEQQIKVDHIMINEGQTFKRWRAVSRGRAHSILKRTSHIRVILETKPLPAPVTTAPTTTKTKPATPKSPAKKAPAQQNNTKTATQKTK